MSSELQEKRDENEFQIRKINSRLFYFSVYHEEFFRVNEDYVLRLELIFLFLNTTFYFVCNQVSYALKDVTKLYVLTQF